MEDDEDDDNLIADFTVKPNTSVPKSENKLTTLKNQVESVIDDMKVNIEKVVDRGQMLHDLDDKSEQLGANADLFNKRSKKLRKTMGLRTCRARMYMGASIAVILILVICNKKNLNIFKII